MQSQVSAYAELLSNIRQISVAVSLPSPSDLSTRANLEADGCNVHIFHQGASCHLRLPAKAAIGATALPVQKQGVSTLSWRLAVSPDALPQINGSQEAAPLWSATDLGADSGVQCRNCSAVIVGAGSVTWKDLPSENWAEMMEFWHCHKPADHGHSHDHSHAGKADEASLAARGYGASSAISAQKSIGFVDLTTLLFSESDCNGLTFSLSTFDRGSTERQDVGETQSRSLNVFCTVCVTQLGFFNFRTTAVTLLKWKLTCKSASGTLPDVPECLASTITATVARSGSSKSLVMPISSTEDRAGQVIHIWVLNSGIVYSSSSVPKATPAIKLLYQLITQEQADKMLEGLTCDAQEISLPASAIEDVVHHLDESNLLLPGSERRLKDWRVGLLAR